MAKVAFIGLGVMGFPMAGHLKQKGGHDVRVYNRTAAKAADWAAKFGGTTGATPAEAVKDADFVFTCVGNDDDLRSVTIGENGVLTVMCGGEQAVFDKAKPIIDAYARMVGLMGPVGAGQLTKMMNQICIAGIVQGLSEAIHFGKQSGLDIEKVVDVISKGAAGSWQMENRHKTMDQGKYDFGFAVDWMRKDLDIVLTEARRNGAKLPLTALVDQFYGDVQAMGGNRWDTSSLLARLERK